MIQAKINGKYDYLVQKNDSEFLVNSAAQICDIQKLGKDYYQVIMNNRCFLAKIYRSEQELIIKINQRDYRLKIKDDNDLMLEKLGIKSKSTKFHDHLKAPMPGQIIDIFIQKGDEMKAGQPLLILKAMKMENIIKAPHDGVISEVFVKKDQKIEKDTVMVQF
jgi:biotin carboxyl carrier protein